MARVRQGPREYWPSWRYAPNGESKLCHSADEVPEGWSRKPDGPSTPLIKQDTQILDRTQLIAELMERRIPIKPTWGNAHMKRILDGDVSPTW